MAMPARARMVIMVVAVLVLTGGIVAFQSFQGRQAQHGGRGEMPQVVTAQEARFEDWQPTLDAVATLRAVRGADLAFEVAGVVAEVVASPGAEVKQGQVLATLRREAEEAQLRQAEAQAALAELSFSRAKEQRAAGIISQAEYDGVAADAQVKRANVQQLAAVLERKRLLAPFPGRVGIVATSPGAYVAVGTPVATLQQLDPIYADFFLPQRELGRFVPGHKVELRLDAFPKDAFRGRVTTVNPKVDGPTRNVQVEATVPNPGGRLIPGMFANVVLESGQPQRHLTLPQTSLTYNAYGSTVFRIKPGKEGGPPTVEQVFVVTGPTRGDQVAILQGLEEGAQVVTSGGLKLRNGSPVKVDNKVLPTNDPRPSPQEH